MSLETWTLEYTPPAGAMVSQTLAEWGIADARLTLQNQQSDTLVLTALRERFDAAPLFAYLGTCRLLDPAGVCRFAGRRMIPERSRSAGDNSISYTFYGPWSYLERTPFGQPWANWESGALVRRFTSHVLLPMILDEDYQPQLVNTGAMIQDVIAFCIGRNGAVMQAGNITPALNLPMDEKTDLRCAQVIQLMLGLSPEARCYFDYTTTPPTFHCIERAQMTAVTATLSDRVTSIGIRERDDLQPSCVAIFYERTDTVDGVSRTIFPQDIYPVGADPFADGAFIQTVRLEGAQITNLFGYLETVPVPDSPDKTWFTNRNLNSGDGDTIIALVADGRDGTLEHEIVDGAVQSWMEDNTAESEDDTVYCNYDFENDRQKIENKQGSVRIKTTNIDATGGVTFKRLASYISAEQPVAGLAQAIYDGLSEPGIDGPLELLESEITSDISLGNTVNIAGGSGRYADIEALPQSISYDLRRRTTSLQLGPPAHLDLDSLLALQRFNRSRRMWTDPSLQSGGDASDSGNDVTLGGAVKQQNTIATPGQPVFAVFQNTSKTVAVNQTAGHVNCDANGVILKGPEKQITVGTLISILQSDAAGKAIQLREVTEIVRDASGNCTSQKRIYLCSLPY